MGDDARIKQACPGCGAKLDMAAGAAGKVVRCPRCGVPVPVPVTATVPVSAGEPTPPAPAPSLTPFERAVIDHMDRYGEKLRRIDGKLGCLMSLLICLVLAAALFWVKLNI